MENENQLDLKEKPEMPKPNYGKFIFIAIIFILIGANVGLLLVLNKQSSMLESKNAILMKEEADRSNCVYKIDSLMVELNRLAIYKSLTRSMVYRDEALMGLKHQVGDIAYAKRDSARVVISDIVIGGSKYEYYIRYRVLRKDNTMEEVIPELIY